MNELKMALRQWTNRPGFTAVMLVSLCLGIAANTTIFSFVNALLLRPAPVEDPNSLWQIWKYRAGQASLKRHGTWSRVAITHLRQHNQSIQSLAGHEVEPTLASWSHQGIGESVQCLMVSGNFFDVCGIRPVMGRFFLPEEDRTPGTHPVAVISQDFWQRKLESDPKVLGRALVLNGVAVSVIGVTPQRFGGVLAGVTPDIWVPFMMAPDVLHAKEWLTQPGSHSVIGLGRLKPGWSLAQATEELSGLTHQFEESLPGDFVREDRAALTPAYLVPVPLRGYVKSFTGVLMGAVLLVLLIACANAANLQLARAVTRRQEMAVRSALGAARRQLIAQLLTESVLLAVVAGGLGLGMSVWLVQQLAGFIPATLPVRLQVEIDWRVLAFTASVSILTGILFGLAPAFRGTRLNLADSLKDDARGLASRRSRLSQALIVAQMALCLMLLLSATLCLRSLVRARAFEPGFVVRDRVTASFNLNEFGYTAAEAKKFRELFLSRVRSLPGVKSAALAGFLPLGLNHSNGVFPVEGQPQPLGEGGFFFERFSVGPGYFQTLGTPLLQGREFRDSDRPGAPRVAVINQAAALRYWAGQNPIGRRFGGPGEEMEIIGVVPTGRYRTLGEDPKPAFFACLLQEQPLEAVVVAHIEGAPGGVLTAVRLAAQELDSRLALTGVSTLEDHLSLALFPMRTSGQLLGVLGIVALVLAVSGLFGVIACSVSQRTREVGVRMALGAQQHDVLKLMMREGLLLAAVGVGLGVLAAIAATRWIRSLLFDVSATDPLTFTLVPLFLFSVAMLACWLPALRATRVDPVVALRSE